MRSDPAGHYPRNAPQALYRGSQVVELARPRIQLGQQWLPEEQRAIVVPGLGGRAARHFQGAGIEAVVWQTYQDTKYTWPARQLREPGNCFPLTEERA